MAMTPPPPPPASSATTKKRVNPATVKKAVNALLKWKQLKNPESKDFIYLLLTLKKSPPKNQKSPHKIPLIHPLQDPQSHKICLIIGDTLSSSETLTKTINSQNIPIAKVLKLSKLKSSEYRSHESKQKLYDSFDTFLVDKRVAHLLPGILGRQFYRKKRKVPVPVDLGKGGNNWKGEIEGACSLVLLSLGGGTCSAVKVGKAEMGREEIVENVVKVVEQAVEVVPKKWKGVRALHLKFNHSLALPIYDDDDDDDSNVIKVDGENVGDKRKVCFDDEE